MCVPSASLRADEPEGAKKTTKVKFSMILIEHDKPNLGQKS